MTITQTIHQIIGRAEKCGLLGVGLQIATFTQETRGNNLPLRLFSGTMVADDKELDEMRRALRKAGWSTDTDSDGVYLINLA